MNDTNAIPRLQEAEQVVENPREKVAIMDAIAYLQLPETMPDKPPTNDLVTADSTTNQPIVIKRLPGEGKKARAAAARTKRPGQRQTVPGQNQPGQTQGTAPDQNTAPQTVPPQ
jgi:hypothetical protein